MKARRNAALRATAAAAPLLALALAAFAVTPAGPAALDTTIYLVRHAEKQAAPAGDPPLSEAGRARAAELRRILSPLGIGTIITSQYLRTKETAGPLAEAKGITPVVVAMAADRSAIPPGADRSIQELVGRIRERQGESVLVVGHSNTLPLIIKALGGAPVPDIPDAEYDNLFVVTISDQGEVALARRKFQPSS